MPSTTTSDPWTLPELTRARRAIVVVDVVESVRLMQEDEAGFIERWRRFVHQVRHEVLPKHGGRMVKSLGDGMLLVFDDCRRACAAAHGLHGVAQTLATLPAEAARLMLRIGIHVAEVVIDELDALGSGVNLASRVTALAYPGETVATSQARDELVDSIDADIVDRGEHFLKHFEQPVRLYVLMAAGCDVLPVRSETAAGGSDWTQPVVAVIPFASADAADASHVIGELYADQVVFALSRSPPLRVISTMSSRRLRGREDALEIAETRLNAAYTIAGRYWLAQGRLTLHVELCDSKSATVVWAERFSGPIDNVQHHSTESASLIAQLVCDAVARHAATRAESRPVHSVDSYALLLGAITLMHRAGADDFARARAMLEELAWRHGRSAAAHAWLAKWHVLRVVQGWAPDATEDSARALSSAQRALDIDPRDALALSVAGLVQAYFRKDMALAGQYYESALHANPNEPLAWLFSATWHSYRDEGAKAAIASKEALALSPLDPMKYFFNSLAATAVLADGQYGLAIELARRSLRANRLHASTWRTLALAQSLSGATGDAKSTVMQLRVIEPSLTAATFLERYPGRDAKHAQRYAQALIDAGLPR